MVDSDDTLRSMLVPSPASTKTAKTEATRQRMITTLGPFRREGSCPHALRRRPCDKHGSSLPGSPRLENFTGIRCNATYQNYSRNPYLIQAVRDKARTPTEATPYNAVDNREFTQTASSLWARHKQITDMRHPRDLSVSDSGRSARQTDINAPVVNARRWRERA
jgi:hypothetical protein